MIASLSGRLIHKGTESVIVDAGGVGYELYIPLSTFYALPEEGAPVRLCVHTCLREDAIHLFGFLTQEEKEVFLLLIGVSGVGPKLARNILSGIAVSDLVGAIASSDKAKLSSIPGIGPKSAERLILELKDKAAALAIARGAERPAAASAEGPFFGDVVSALENLGYKTAQAEEAVRKGKAALPEGFGFEELLKESLKCVSRK